MTILGQGTTYPTFREACRARGLLGYDTEWSFVFDETVLWATPNQLRNLFVTILMFCDVGNASVLFNKYWTYMSQDILYGVRRALRNQSYSMPENLLRYRLLKELTVLFEKSGGSIMSYNLPDADAMDGGSFLNSLVAEEMGYDRSVLATEWETMYESLNIEQLDVYGSIIDAVNDRRPGVFFESGYGGTGKTFLWRTIAAKLRSCGKIVLAVASFGVAALLLPGGRTARSRFHIPVDVDDSSVCGIGRGTVLADLVRQAALILWDEALDRKSVV